LTGDYGKKSMNISWIGRKAPGSKLNCGKVEFRIQIKGSEINSFARRNDWLKWTFNQKIASMIKNSWMLFALFFSALTHAARMPIREAAA